MITLKLKNNKGKLSINSEEIKKIIESRPDFESIRDISYTIKQKNVVAFDCKLSEEIFDLSEIEELAEEIGDQVDESYFDVVFDDIRAYLKDSTDEIEEELQDRYSIDNIRCFFDVYNIDDSFTDFKFVFVVSFEDIKISSLTNLCQIVGRRQLAGASKFYS